MELNEKLIDLEAHTIKKHIEDAIIRERVKKLIGGMLTDDLKVLYNMLVVDKKEELEINKLPTAEDIVNEIKLGEEYER